MNRRKIRVKNNKTTISPAHNSLRYRLILMLICTMLPLIIVVLLNVLCAIRVIESKTAQQYRNELSYYLNQLDYDMNNVDRYLAKLSSNNDDIVFLQYGADEDTRKLASLSLHNTLSTDIVSYAPIEGVFLYSSEENLYISSTDSSMPILENLCYNQNTGGKWKLQSFPGGLYLTHTFYNESLLYGAWCKTDTFLKNISFSDEGILIWADETGTALSPIDDCIPNFSKGYNRYYLINGTPYYVVSADSQNGDFSLAALIPVSSVLREFKAITYLDLLLIIVSVCLFPIWYILLQRWIIFPVNRLTNAMEKLGKGNFSFRVEECSGISEYRLMNQTFNAMSGEIESLKIDIYERQVEKQRIELEKLQMQTNPHFLMNSLNIIYNLAKNKNTNLIQDMSLCLVEYYRYITQSDRPLVTIREELSHVQNYLHIQEMRFSGKFSSSFIINGKLLDAYLPPMTVQIFVENVIKHALMPLSPIHLDILVEDSILYPGESFTVEIRDSGPGFKEDILQKLLHKERCSSEGHVGIWNVQQRLSIIYGDAASISFKNAPSGGGIVTISLPLQITPENSIF